MRIFKYLQNLYIIYIYEAEKERMEIIETLVPLKLFKYDSCFRYVRPRLV